ncbi:head-tail connector protein [Sphingomonas hankookensis]|uniref:Phage gp6-like head-tail connector protein n=1 Tax=Sphingomonas hankookensis TaxID=563996 RepID=A0ABR5YF13_9SPHN|nr:head-tail connector protein [Sphingomonas hankookensis]KZE16219.1 hypothetical protein AVT10_12015 [Sphingomonas hankookensis]
MTALTLDLVKAFLRYEADNTDEDATLGVALQAGVEYVQDYTGRAIAGEDPETIPAGLLHGVLLYAGAFDQARGSGGDINLAAVQAVCFRFRTVLL